MDCEILTQKNFSGAHGGVLAGGIGVHDENDRIGIPTNEADMLFRNGGAERGDGGRDASTMAADDVDLAFT